MLCRRQVTRVLGAVLGSWMIQALFAAAVAACSNGNGFPTIGG